MKNISTTCKSIYSSFLFIQFSFRFIAKSSDKVKNTDVIGDAKITCKFGDLTLNRYQELETGNKCETCKCLQPPLLACVQDVNCSN